MSRRPPLPLAPPSEDPRLGRPCRLDSPMLPLHPCRPRAARALVSRRSRRPARTAPTERESKSNRHGGASCNCALLRGRRRATRSRNRLPAPQALTAAMMKRRTPIQIEIATVEAPVKKRKRKAVLPQRSASERALLSERPRS